MGDRAKFAASAAFYLLALAAQMSGWTNSTVAVVLFVIATVLLLVPSWHHCRQWQLRRAGTGAMGTPQIVLLIGLAGTWLFMTVALGTAGWMVYSGQGFTVGSSVIGVGAKAGDEGPLQWVHNFSLEGGFGQNVFALTFRGANTSKMPVQIKEAYLISLVDGTLLPLEIVGVDPTTDENKVVPIDKVQMIIPGAPVQLVAKFGPPDPANPGKILGLDQKVFLEKWRQFSFNVKDDTPRAYKFDYNENSLMPFFQGRYRTCRSCCFDGHSIALRPIQSRPE